MESRVISNPFEALFNNATVGILVVNVRGDIQMINNFALDIFGYTREELLGGQLTSLIPKASREQHAQYHLQYFMNPASRPMGRGLELSGMHKDGHLIPVEISLGYYKDAGEHFVIAVVNDISAKKQQEQELKMLAEDLERKVQDRTADLNEAVHGLEAKMSELTEMETDLRNTKEYLEYVLNHLEAIIVITDKQRIVLWMNRTGEKKLGYAAGEMSGKPLATLYGNGRQSAGFIPGTGQTSQVETEMVRKNGTRFPVALSVTPTREPGAGTTGYLGIAFDISRLKKVEEDLSASLKKERELGELKSRFVSMASHEFRTPLSTILSSVYLLSKYKTTEDQPKRDKHINRIEASIQMLNDILNDFLSMGRIEEGKIHLKWSRFDIRDPIREVIQEITPVLKPGQHIHYVHNGEKSVHLDESLFKHIMLNLLSNATKFSPENAAVDIESSGTDENTVIIVRDHGIGIPEQDQPHLFERFFRAGNAENVQGTGLGLHIVGRYVELLHGSIHYKSQLEKGTEFTITFKRS